MMKIWCNNYIIHPDVDPGDCFVEKNFKSFQRFHDFAQEIGWEGIIGGHPTGEEFRRAILEFDSFL